MSLIRYGHPMLALHQQLNRMFDGFDSELFGQLEELGEGLFAPPVDVREDDAAYTVWLEVPGVRRDALDISLQNNVLTIKGIKEQAAVEGRYRRVERTYGSFVRSLTLPRNVDDNGVAANLENGVLQVTLPKREEARARQIAVSATVDSQPAAPAGAKPANEAAPNDGASNDAASNDAAPASNPS